MARDPDDDALRWEGDDDPSLAPGWKTVGASVPLTGSTDDGQRDGAGEGAPVDADAETQSSSAELVLLGVLGGVYLLYSIGWLIAGSAAPPRLADPVAQFMYALGRWCAVAAPALWFATVMRLAAGHRRARLIWLIAGALILVPVPFLVRG